MGPFVGALETNGKKKKGEMAASWSCNKEHGSEICEPDLVSNSDNCIILRPLPEADCTLCEMFVRVSRINWPSIRNGIWPKHKYSD
mgnify:CR=1 FL=1